jgi:hypothetical protein
MRKFKDGDTITIEPWRSAAFPVIKDLVVNRNAFDQILQAGGFVSVNTGGIPDANAIPIPKEDADESMDAAIDGDYTDSSEDFSDEDFIEDDSEGDDYEDFTEATLIG